MKLRKFILMTKHMCNIGPEGLGKLKKKKKPKSKTNKNRL